MMDIPRGSRDVGINHEIIIWRVYKSPPSIMVTRKPTGPYKGCLRNSKFEHTPQQ
jgi:hypothetical protein